MFWIGIAQVVAVGDELVRTLGIGDTHTPPEALGSCVRLATRLAHEMPILGTSLADAVSAPDGATVAITHRVSDTEHYRKDILTTCQDVAERGTSRTPIAPPSPEGEA